MTADANDMSTPVTRGELREELAHFEDRLERKFDRKLDDRFEQFERKVDRKLDDRFEQFEHKVDRKLDDRFEQFERKFDHKLELWGGALLARIVESEKHLVGEIARHTQAVLESMTQQISVIDEKYCDLPARTARLEADVQGLKQR